MTALNNRFLVIVLSTVAPTSFYLSNNYNSYSRDALPWIMAASAALGAIAAVCTLVVERLFYHAKAEIRRFRYPEAIIFLVLLTMTAPVVYFALRFATPFLERRIRYMLFGGLAVGIFLVLWLFVVLAAAKFVADAKRSLPFLKFESCLRSGSAAVLPVASGLFLFAVFTHVTWADILSGFWAVILFCAAFVFLSTLASKSGFKAINIFLLTFILISLVNIYRGEAYSSIANVDLHPPEAMPSDFSLKRKPNIYFMFMESMHSRDAIKEIYGFDAPDFFDFLRRGKFSIYDNIYSNYHGTLQAMLSLVSMRHHYWRTDFGVSDESRTTRIFICNNTIFKILKNNGYNINIFDSSDYIFRFKSPFVDFTNIRQFDGAGRSAVAAFESMNKYIRKATWFFDSLIHGEVMPFNAEEFERYYPAEFNLKNPSFFFFHFGAGHLVNPMVLKTGEIRVGYNDLSWDEFYRDLYQKACNQATQMINRILLHDPEALIVLLGDHGAAKFGTYRDTASLSIDDANDLVRERGLTPAFAAKNLVSVLLAIRWPKQIQPRWEARDGLSGINLFPYIFSALNEMEYKDDEFSSNVSYFDSGGRIVAKYGRLLENWEEFSENPAR